MNELLGFIVLSGPLLLILLWLPVSIWIAFKVSKRFTQPGKKLAVGISLFILTLLLPFADEIIGRIYFNHLCTTQAGVKVYQTVELSAEYWDGEGRARFLNENGDLDKTMLERRLSEPAIKNTYSNFFGIDEYRHQVVDTHKTLGEVINFMHWGGWISRNLNPGGPSAIDCKNFQGNKFWQDFYLSLFSRSNQTPSKNRGD